MEEDQLTKKEKRELAKEEKQKQAEKEKTSGLVRKLATWILIAGVIVFIGSKAIKWGGTAPSQINQNVTQVGEDEWVKGKKNAKVTLVEYSDFQCPACANYAPLVVKLNSDFPDDLRIVYRHFPLITIHKNAVPSGVAAESAGAQGKFWEMHNMLFEKQQEWSGESDPKPKFIEYAKELGLNEEQFKSDLGSDTLKEKVTASGRSALSLKLNQTPTFFLNGVKIQPRGYDEFKKLVEDQIRGYTVE